MIADKSKRCPNHASITNPKLEYASMQYTCKFSGYPEKYKQRKRNTISFRQGCLFELLVVYRKTVRPYHKKDKRRPIIIWFPKNCTNICHTNDFFQTMLKKMCNKRYHWNRIANYCNKSLKTLVSILHWKV